MTVLDFFRIGLRDVEGRLARLTQPALVDDTAIWQVLDRSLPGRVVATIASVWMAAASSSRSVMVWRQAHSAWLGIDPTARVRLIGAVVLVAVLTHLAMVATQRPVGFWWLIVPALAAAFGITAVVASSFGPPNKGDRA